MKYYLVAGEASGDLHGSNLIRELKALDPEAQFRCFGGELMEKEGGVLVRHYREMAFMGIINVLLNIRTIGQILNQCKSDILVYRPNVVILIDYPGFNLKIAEFAKASGFKVFYYIAPKVWAWREWRIKKIKAYVDVLFSILPFELEYFGRHNIRVEYIGNPLTDAIESYKSGKFDKSGFFEKNGLNDKPVVALLSGSRSQEIRNTLPVMKNCAVNFRDYQFVVAGVSSVDQQLYNKILKGSDIKIVFNQTYDLLNVSYAALVASGTAALETALFKVPQAVLYRVEGGWPIHLAMKYFFLKINWVSLPNLIANKTLVKEFLQVEMTVERVLPELKKLIYDQSYRNIMLKGYDELEEKTGASGCSEKAAHKMIELLNK
jgi:lipid-A-disaccharide synthase